MLPTKDTNPRMMKSTPKIGPKTVHKSTPEGGKSRETGISRTRRSPKRGEKSTEKRGPKRALKIPPKCPMTSSSIFVSFFNFILFLKCPQCERSEPLFPNNLLLNFAVHFIFVSFLQPELV
jgi:hypothetical protein